MILIISQGDIVFVKQYVEFGGLSPKIVQHLLKDTNPTGVLIDTLQIISQLAR